MKSLKPQIKLSILALALVSITACGYSGNAKSGGGYYYSGYSYERSSYNNPVPSRSADAGYNQSKSQSSQQSQINENPFAIRGINADFLLIQGYSHNYFIELVYAFGILGGFFSCYILFKIAVTIEKGQCENQRAAADDCQPGIETSRERRRNSPTHTRT